MTLATKFELKDTEITLRRDFKDLEIALKRDIKELELRLTNDLTVRLGGMMLASIAAVSFIVKFV